MARVVWTGGALAELELIRTYIAIFDSVAAERLAARLTAAAESLCHFPNRGRPAGGGKRELPAIRPYVIRYDVRGETVFVLSIKHGAQRR